MQTAQVVDLLQELVHVCGHCGVQYQCVSTAHCPLPTAAAHCPLPTATAHCALCTRSPTRPPPGPRQPWHDIHSRLEGPIAWDVLENFHQRWEKQAGLHRKHRILNLQHAKQLLVPSNGATHRTGDPRVFVTPPDSAASWNVQLFRSIDSDSVVGFPETNREAFELDLVTGKGTTVERSIHKAYIYAIRRAQRFLYIENQYFLGSAQAWPTGAHPAGGCDHLVCVEIALKCVEKIKAGVPFCAYILIPPFPEGALWWRPCHVHGRAFPGCWSRTCSGMLRQQCRAVGFRCIVLCRCSSNTFVFSTGNPCDASVQEILYWQAQTMRMMYGLIAAALKEAGSKAAPTDYLQFFFVGQREPVGADEVSTCTGRVLRIVGRLWACWISSCVCCFGH